MIPRLRNIEVPITLLALTWGGDLVAKETAKPNILIIYADDLGYGDVAIYNPERGKIPTPNIDQLARQGMRFTDAHASAAVCTPSRYSLLTGRYHWRSRLQDGVLHAWEGPLIPPDRPTIASLAREKGYQTACIGKWHLGWNWTIPEEYADLFKRDQVKNYEAIATERHRRGWEAVFGQSIHGGPTALGFEEYFGVDLPNWPPYVFIENDRTVGIPSDFLPSQMVGRYDPERANVQGPAMPDWKLEAVLPAITSRACAYVLKAAAAPGPFLLYFSLTSPHTPLAVNAEWRGKSGLGLYADFVMETDAAVGEVLAALEASGQAENTLVILTSDNGCAPYIGVHEMEKSGHFPSGPLRGYKADVWEGGHRVPFIVRWPGHVKPNSINHRLVHQADLFRTIAEIAEAEVPEGSGEDSFSFLSLLKGEETPTRPHSVSTSFHGVPALQWGGWKYIAAPGSGSGGRGQKGDPEQPVQLYNLAEDIGETHNLAVAMPEKVAEMQALLEKLIADGRSTPGPPGKNDVEVIRYPRSKAVPKD